jgi:hypothetical protein
MRQPLIIRGGLVQACGPLRLNIPKLNLGPAIQTFCVSNSIHLEATIHHLYAGVVRHLDNIWGGEDGDVLILTGEKVRLRPGGNIGVKKILKLSRNEASMFLFINDMWSPV